MLKTAERRSATEAPTENIDTGYPVLQGCEIRCGTLHWNVNKEEPPSDWPSDGGLFRIAMLFSDSRSFRTLDCLTNTYMNVIIINTY